VSKRRPQDEHANGVNGWAKGRHVCRIVCTRGHKKRTIDRMMWDGEGGVLFSAGTWRRSGEYDGPGRPPEPGGSAERTPLDPAHFGREGGRPVGNAFKWRLRCP